MNTPEDLRSQVRIYTDWAQQMIQDHGNVMSEKDTETRLVEPVLDMLNWDTKNINVRKGYRVKTEGANYEADYALMIDSSPRILIEVKKVANNLRDEDVLQLMKYAFYEKADIFILTNGNEWRVYEPYHLKDMVFKFALDNMENNLDCLWLLSRDSIGTGLLDQELDRRYAIEKVYGYIEKHKGEWVSDIAGMSKKFTTDSIGDIMDMAIIDKSSVLGGLSAEEMLPSVNEELTSTGVEPPTINEGQAGESAGDYTGQKLVSFQFDDSPQIKTDSWKELLPKLCQIIVNKHKDQFDNVLGLDGAERIGVNKPTRVYFTRDKTEKEHMNEPEEVPGMGIWVETHWQANQTEKICHDLISYFGYKRDDLRLEIHKHTLDEFFSKHRDMMPIFRELESRVKQFGDDVKILVKTGKTHIHYIGLEREKPFGNIRMSGGKMDVKLLLGTSVTHTRLRDVKLKSTKPRRGLNKVTTISKIEDIDNQLVEWMKQSYDRS